MTAQPTVAQLHEKSEKILSRHLERLAIVYIRQSSLTQVHHNLESGKLQYGLVNVAQRLGWAPERILTIDEDQGLSGKSAEGRDGFQRVLREVAFDHVGIVLGVEISRLSRSNKDWYHLLEVCARFGTLIADLDGLYDPGRYNDRLLLGLKGTMSEAELHVLRQRLMQGKISKAQRGELYVSVPSGYLRTPSGEIVMDPDEEVRAVVHLVFETFEKVGTSHGVLRELNKHGVRIGVRRRTGPDIGSLEWHRVHRGLIINMLRHPIYAGTYTYGRRQADPRRQKPGQPASGRTSRPRDQWIACVRDRFPAYITWDQYERNQMRLNANRSFTGPIRGGSALLQGMVQCGRCGLRMSVQYVKARNGRTYARYVCGQEKAHFGTTKICASVTAHCIDRIVSELSLAALAPGALELSLRVAEEIERERDKRDELWQKRLQRARYEAERAERQYHAVEPENRLVARTLEKNWEAKLAAERQVQEEHRRHQEAEPRHLSADERETIRALAQNLPALWYAATTTVEDRKTVLRILIEVVTITVDTQGEWTDLTVNWVGGHKTSRRFRRPVGSLTQMGRHQDLLAEMNHLRSDGLTARDIAEKLNGDGWTTPTQRNGFNERLVRAIWYRHGTVPRGPKRPPSNDSSEWWLLDLAKELKIPRVTLYGWHRRGWLRCRADKERGGWVAIADRRELNRLRRLRDQSTRGRR